MEVVIYKDLLFIFIFLISGLGIREFRKGDYCRYLAEFKTDQERKEAAELSLKGYEACYFGFSFISMQSIYLVFSNFVII